MRNGGNWRVRLIVIWLLALMLCSACRTVPASSEVRETEATLAVLIPPRPAAPVMEPVLFEDREGGLWLAYEQYRALERNVISLRNTRRGWKRY